MKNTLRKRLVSWAVVLSMLLSCVAGGATASAAKKQWTKDNLEWTDGDDSIILTLSDDGTTFTVTGTGAMGNYAFPYDQDYADDVDNVTKVEIQDGITAVGKMNFVAIFTSLETVTIEKSVVKIGATAFAGCTNVTIDIKGQLTEVGSDAFGNTRNSTPKKIIVYDQASYNLVKASLPTGTTIGEDIEIESKEDTAQSKADLQELVKTTREKYKEADYTPESYEGLSQALTKADGVIANDQATTTDFIEATQAIEDAIKKLVSHVDVAKKELNTAITSAKQISNNAGSYTTSSVAALKEAISSAEAIVQKGDATLEEVNKAKDDLAKATRVDETGLAETGLKKKADLTHLQSLDGAVNFPEKSELYTKESYAEYQEVLDRMKAMQKNKDDITNEQVDAILAELEAAKGKLVEDKEYAPDYEEYEKAKAAVLAILNAENSPYTKNSLEALKKVYDYQISIVENDEGYKAGKVQSQIDEVTRTLKYVIDPEDDGSYLVEKGDITELAALVASAKQLEGSKYTEESWKTLSDKLEEVEALLEELIADPDNAAKTEIEAAVQELKEAVAGLVEKQVEQKPGDKNQTPKPSDKTPGSTNTNTDKDTKTVTVKKVTLKKVTSPKKKTLKVQWKKVSDATGYQIQIGTNKKMTKNKKVINIKKAKTVTKTIKKLKSKKKYYVKVRAYKTVNGKKVYGAWSKPKKVKVK